MADIDILRAEIMDDPLGLGYEDMEDGPVADALNTPNRAGKKEVPAADVRSYLLLNLILPDIETLAQTSTNPIHAKVAKTVMKVMEPNSFDNIRMTNPAILAQVSSMLGVMVQAGVMTSQQRAEMIALGDTQISRAQELGLGQVHHLQVAEARNV